MPSPADDQPPTVYLEDIDPSYGAKKPEYSQEQRSPHSSQSTVNASQEKPSGSNKRQRTLEDMFFGGKKGKEPVKKIKLSTSDVEGSAVKKIIVPPLKTSGLQKLNSIPFSLSEFIESLDEDKKQLLRLECEVMGKSWSGFLSALTAPLLTFTIHRLKILKDEITKPYFVSLKRYLWNVGVKGPDDTLKSCKVYPPGSVITPLTSVVC
jgi:uracil-DNA glycosylase